MRPFMIFTMLLLVIPAALAYEDNYFFVKNIDSHEAVPGDDMVISFEIEIKDLSKLEEVTAYIDDCPTGWVCSEKTFTYDDEGVYPENLTISVPETALPRKYTMYVKLKGDVDIRRGDDSFKVTVLSEEQAGHLTYEEYLAKQEEVGSEPEKVPNPALYDEPESEPEEQETEIEETAGPVPEPERISSPEPEDEGKLDEVVDNVERLETSHQFVEYASIVLGIVLVFIAIGAYVTYKRNKE